MGKLDTSAERILFSKWHHVDSTSYFLTTTGTHLEMYINSSGSGYGYKKANAEHGKNVGEWFHLAVVYTAASGTLEFFVDGDSVGSGTGNGLPTSIADTAAPFRIGTRENPSSYWEGNLDDVRIWSRALSDTEIDDLYDYPSQFDNGSDLEGYWKFDGDWDDSSENGNHLGPSFSFDTAY